MKTANEAILRIPGEKITIKTSPGKVLFWGSGHYSGACAHHLSAHLHKAFIDMGGVQQYGLQGEKISPRMEEEMKNLHDGIDEAACEIFEGLTGIKIRISRQSQK